MTSGPGPVTLAKVTIEPRVTDSVAGGRFPPSAEGTGARRFWHILLSVAVVGVLLRACVVVLIPTRPASDPWSYFQRAQNVLHHGRYEAFPGILDANFPPAYPLAIAAVSALGGQGSSLARAKALNCLLGGAGIVLIGLLARRLFGAPTGLLAAAMLAIYPRGLLQAPVLVSEHLFTPLLLLLVLVLVMAWERAGAAKCAVLAGVTVGLLALTRPIGYLLGVLWLGRGWAIRGRWPAVLRELALLLAVQHLVMLPWAIRNAVSLGQFSFLSSVGGIDLFLGNNPTANGGWQVWRPVLDGLEPAARSQQLGCFELDALARRTALRWMRAHPRQAFRLYVTKLGLILQREESLPVLAITGTNMWPPLDGVDALPAGHPATRFADEISHTLDWSYRTVLLLATVGIVVVFVRRLRSPGTVPAAVWLLPVSAAYFVAVPAVFLGSTRFRWPAEDLLVAMAALTVTVMLNSVRRVRVRARDDRTPLADLSGSVRTRVRGQGKEAATISARSSTSDAT